MNLNLKQKSEAALLSELKTLVAKERELTMQILDYLKEVEARGLHLERGYSSLFTFMTEGLGYSEGAAHRRIAAMRLTKSLPEVTKKLQTGELSLTVAAKAQSFFKEEDQRRKEKSQKKITLEEKREVVSQLMGTSTRECERKLAAISPEAARPKEIARPISDETTLIQFVADSVLMEKLERLKNLLAHKNWEGKYAPLFHELADVALKKLDPTSGRGFKESTTREPMKPEFTAQGSRMQAATGAREPATQAPNIQGILVKETIAQGARNQVQEAKAQEKSSALELTSPKNETVQNESSTKTNSSELEANPNAVGLNPVRDEKEEFSHSRYIPKRDRRLVWVRDEGRCSYRDAKTGRLCGSRHGLQNDHIQPLAMGGATSAGNLRLLCAGHHRLVTQGLMTLLE